MPTIDLRFKLNGDVIPVDHGYLLYGALSRLCPFLHGAENYHDKKTADTGIHPIAGTLVGNRLLSLNKDSYLTVRLDSADVISVLPLAGREVVIGDNRLQIGIPQPHMLAPAESLHSRLVTIKGKQDAESFLEAVNRQLKANGIEGVAQLTKRKTKRSFEGQQHDTSRHSTYVRRTIRIKGTDIVGYAVTVSGLSAEDSITLQEVGIGGRRRCGCGIFVR